LFEQENAMFGWFTDPTAEAALADQVKIVAPRTIMQWMSDNEVVIVDVREPNEWAQGHIPGATLMSISAFNPAAVPVDEGKKLVFHCQGGVRCGMAAAKMVEAGFKGPIHRMDGGIMGWRSQGGHITIG
jgi:rhodanese-related sulfurtransferase